MKKTVLLMALTLGLSAWNSGAQNDAPEARRDAEPRREESARVERDRQPPVVRRDRENADRENELRREADRPAPPAPRGLVRERAREDTPPAVREPESRDRDEARPAPPARDREAAPAPRQGPPAWAPGARFCPCCGQPLGDRAQGGRPGGPWFRGGQAGPGFAPPPWAGQGARRFQGPAQGRGQGGPGWGLGQRWQGPPAGWGWQGLRAGPRGQAGPRWQAPAERPDDDDRDQDRAPRGRRNAPARRG